MESSGTRTQQASTWDLVQLQASLAVGLYLTRSPPTVVITRLLGPMSLQVADSIGSACHKTEE